MTSSSTSEPDVSSGFSGSIPRQILIGSYILIIAVFCFFRARNFSAIEQPMETSDTKAFMEIASMSLLDLGFWTAERAGTVPLLYKLLFQNRASICFFQFGLSVLSCVALGLAAARPIQTPVLKAAGLAGLLLFLCSPEVVLWDCVILSESVSISLFLLLIACWLLLMEEWTPARVAAFLIIEFIWIFTRESNAWFSLMLAGVIAVPGIAIRRLRHSLILAGVLVLFFMCQNLTSNAGHRWFFPFLNVLSQRILPDAGRTNYFEQHGMPVSPRLMEMKGKWASSDDWAYYKDPALADFRKWGRSDGKSTYIKFLLSRPVGSVGDALQDVRAVFVPNVMKYAPDDFSTLLPRRYSETFFPRRDIMLWTAVALFLAVFAVIIAIRERQPAWATPVFLILVAFPHGIFIWLADAMEIGRHGVQVSIHLRLGIWLLLWLFADRIATDEGIRARFTSKK
jgi:hypothetical protein